MKKLFGCFLTLILLFCAQAQALVLQKNGALVDVAVFSAYEKVHPTQNSEFLVRFKMKDGWHIFAQDAGEIGMPTQVLFQEPENWQVLENSWSKDKSFNNQGFIQKGFNDTAYYKTTLKPVGNINTDVSFKLKIKWLACKEDCVPGFAQFEFKQPVTSEQLSYTAKWQKELAEAQRWFYPSSGQKIYWGAVLVFAFLGGLILNVMPCILPILTLKALALVQSSYDKRKNQLEALFYTLGVIVSFMVVATILLLLRRSGTYVGWGFQLQSPIFVSLMILLFVGIALMLLDVIKLNIPLTNVATQMNFHNHLISSFMTGLLAVLIASPCTAPFMGLAIGYTLTAPVITYYPVFLALALGYALPFALINLYPRPLKHLLPKPGKWMLVLKRIFAIPVLLTALWLGWVLYAQLAKPELRQDTLNWQAYDETLIQENLQQKKPVFINFTAKWCLTCLLNKRAALQSQSFENLVQSQGISLFEADWTNNDEKIAKALEKYGRNSIPLYVYYDGKSEDYLLLPQLLTPAILEEYLR